MEPWLIIVIVVVVLLLLALLFLLPRMRQRAQVRAHEREVQAREQELAQRREQVAGEQRAQAEERRLQAERAEQKAQLAAAEAQRERAEADVREQRAAMHERGMADEDLIDESERDRFAGTSAMGNQPTRGTEPGTAGAYDTGAVRDDRQPTSEPASDYEQGRIDERRDRDDPSDPRRA